MKKLLIIAIAILILVLGFQSANIASAAQDESSINLLPLFSENDQAQPPQQYNISSTMGMDLTGIWDILLFYNDAGVDREIWYLTQKGTTITGHSRYITARGDVIRNKITGILNGSYLTLSVKSGPDYVTEFNARIGNNGNTIGAKSSAPDGTSFQQTLKNIDEGRGVNLSYRSDRWINMNGQWWGQKRAQQSDMQEENWLYEQSQQNYYQSQENNQQTYDSELDLTGVWDILLFYDDGGVNREVWYLTQKGTLISGFTQYRADEGDVFGPELTGRLNGSNLTISLKSGNYVTNFQVRISDNGMSMGTRKNAPDGASFQQTMKNIDEGRAVKEKNTPNRYMNGDWWGHKRAQ